MNIEEMILGKRIKRMFDYLNDEIKEKRELSQFKEDVIIVINSLLYTKPENLTAVEIQCKEHERNLYKKQLERLEQQNKEHQKENGELQEKLTKAEKMIDLLEKWIKERCYYIDAYSNSCEII